MQELAPSRPLYALNAQYFQTHLTLGEDAQGMA